MAPDRPNHGISVGNAREKAKSVRFGKISAHEVQMNLLFTDETAADLQH